MFLILPGFLSSLAVIHDLNDVVGEPELGAVSTVTEVWVAVVICKPGVCANALVCCVIVELICCIGGATLKKKK